MNDAAELMKQFKEFKIETKARLASYPVISKQNYQRILQETLESVLKEQEKVSILNKIFITSLVSGVIIILLILFILYVMLFTVPL